MGEYAIRKSDGEEVKIGTCEDMYYLRYEQRGAVRALDGNVDPASDDRFALRFRFPWPDEDDIEVGSDKYHDNGYHRGITVPGMAADPNVEHYNVQFVAQHQGYVTSLPCPEANPNPTIHRNGFAGAVQLVAQKPLKDGRVVPILRCACGAMWRLEDASEITALAVAFRSEGDRKHKDSWRVLDNGEREYCGRVFWDTIADRILLGVLLLEPSAERAQ